MIYDICSFNGEFDLLKLRLNILSPYVDKFIVVEFDKTFSGKDKPFYGQDMDEILEPWKGKVDWHYHTEKTYSKYKELAESSPNTVGAEHWKTEFMMKESIKDCLTNLKDENILEDDDIVFIGDCDEIWETSVGFYTKKFNFDEPKKLRLRVYTYWLNNKSNEDFWGTIVCHYGDIKNECLNHLRINLPKTEKYYGWHFTSLAPYLKNKLEDSYTKDSYATEQVLNNLEDNIQENKDFLGRDFKYIIDESELPKYLLEHKEKYKHLMKPNQE